MQKQAPTFGRLLTMTLFAFSCFGLLLFLWLSFGGPTPLNPKGYQFEAAFEEGAQLGVEAEVRVSGVAVGKVKDKRVDPQEPNRVIATLEIDERYAPVARDARASLRTKAILGETYVALTLGSRDGPFLAEGERLQTARVGDAVQIDEMLSIYDPITRMAFRTWQQDLAKALNGRGRDLNDAFGNLPGFVDSGGDLLAVLDDQRAALAGLVRNTGVVFGALTEKEEQLRALVENTDTVFTAIQREKESFADLWQVFPTFLTESRLTYNRLATFAEDTRPLIRELKPAFDDLGPTLRSLGDLSPDLRRLYARLDPLLRQSLVSLPATREVLDGLRPLLGELGPFLTQFNPILDWLAQHQGTVSDIFANLGWATSATTKSGDPKAPGHYLRQVSVSGVETAASHPNRLGSNRGNAYPHPLGMLPTPQGAPTFVLPSYDCNNTGFPGDGTKGPEGGTPLPTPACRIAPPYQYRGMAQKFPHLQPGNYANGNQDPVGKP